MPLNKISHTSDRITYGDTVRLRLTIAYDGTNFAGWAPQRNQRTVAGELNTSLSTIFHHPIQLVAAGRTDTGVHATGQVAHMDLPAEALSYAQPQRRRPETEPEFQSLLIRLAKFLPSDVRVLTLDRAPEGFDARFSALRRHYVYRLSTALYGVLPHQSHYVAHWPRHLDLDAINAASTTLLGVHDFAAFCRHRQGATTIRDLQRCEWKIENHIISAHVSADAFCWSMVRSLVGALLAVGEHRRDIHWCTNLLDATRRSSDFSVAPACGLTLEQVDYPPEDQLASRIIQTRNLRTLDTNTSSLPTSS